MRPVGVKIDQVVDQVDRGCRTAEGDEGTQGTGPALHVLDIAADEQHKAAHSLMLYAAALHVLDIAADEQRYEGEEIFRPLVRTKRP